MKIYTKTGDKGKTQLLGGSKVKKNHSRLETYGTIDELNSLLGVVRSVLTQTNKGYLKYLSEITLQIQDDLFSIGSYLANPANSDLIKDLSSKTLVFEKYIDEIRHRTFHNKDCRNI